MIDPEELHNARDRKVGRINNSYYVTLPKKIVDQLDLQKGDHVTIGECDGQIVLIPITTHDAPIKAATDLAELISHNDD